MAQADFGTGKTLAVLAIVLGCFAILWPKIFYPMWQAAFALSSTKLDSDGRYREVDRPPHLHPGSINPRMKATPENIHEKFMMREGRPFPHPQARQPVKSQPKSGGAMSIIMPIYTVGIIVFFIYTVLKLVFKKNPEEQKPLIKDFHMDPEYRKFIYQQPDEVPKASKTNRRKKKTNLCGTTIPENKAEECQAEELDAKDYEIYKLKKKLDEMQLLMQSLNKSPQVRNRRKGETKKSDPDKTSKKWHVAEEGEYEKSEKELEEDLGELLKMCSATKATIKSFDSTSDLPSDTVEEDVARSESEEESSDGNESEEKDSLLEDMVRNKSKKKLPCA